jgi:hypothetical protein
VTSVPSLVTAPEPEPDDGGALVSVGRGVSVG